MKDLIFRNLHGLKHEILKKSRRVIFFRFLYFPYMGSKNKMDQILSPGEHSGIFFKKNIFVFVTNIFEDMCRCCSVDFFSLNSCSYSVNILFFHSKCQYCHIYFFLLLFKTHLGDKTVGSFQHCLHNTSEKWL